MSACEQFRRFLDGEMARLRQEDEHPNDEYEAIKVEILLDCVGNITRTFDELHQHNQENTGDKCSTSND